MIGEGLQPRSDASDDLYLQILLVYRTKIFLEEAIFTWPASEAQHAWIQQPKA